MADIQFPIEGKSAWLTVMRALFFSLPVFLALFYYLFASNGGFGEGSNYIFLGVAAIMLLEVPLIRFVVVPLSQDYGRFRVLETGVEYYPLSASGLSVGSTRKIEKLSAFKGVQVIQHHSQRPVQDNVRLQTSAYNVCLVHPRRALNVTLRQFADPQSAAEYAAAFAARTGLKTL